MAPSPTMRRLLKETSELSSTAKNPNPAFHAAPVSDTDLHEWHFTLLGPPSPSPYAGGLYHGRISLPPSYPLKPPNFRFLTPSGRFEVNREICLSISGFHEETWMPAWGVRTALTALRSFMAESGTAGQVGGLEAPKEVRERLAKESRGWRCKECGSRSNEDIMRDWWEACAEKGVKVGEDIGLEALPEGLNLEAKVPASSKPDRGEDTSIVKEGDSTGHKELATASTPAFSTYNEVDNGQRYYERATGDLQRQTPVIQPSGQPGGHAQLSSVVNRSTPMDDRSSINSDSSVRQEPTQHHRAGSSITTPPSQQYLNPPVAVPTTSHSSSQAVHNPPGQHQPPATISNTLSSTHQHQPQSQPQRQRQEEPAIITIDRAIYVVFVALCIMILKKIFYPASNTGGPWGDMTMMRE